MVTGSLRSTVAGIGPARESQPGSGGRILATIGIGVIGHRDPADPDVLRAPVREALSRPPGLVHTAPDAGFVLVVVSAVAEGADRLVTEQALAGYDARLEVALPWPADDYEGLQDHHIKP
jgi:hypothetical protein